MSCCRGFSHRTDSSSLFSRCPPPCLFPLQAKSCICHMCGAHLNRLHSCLYCVFFGCFTKKHIHEHAKNKRHNLGKPPNSPGIVLHTSKASVPSRYSGPLQHQLLSMRDYSITLGDFLHCFLSSTLPFWWEPLYPVKCHGFMLEHSPLDMAARDVSTLLIHSYQKA